MLVHLVNNDYGPSKVFTDKSMAEEYFSYLNSIYGNRVFKPTIREIELITNEFIQQILQPKEQHEINTNSSVQ